MRFLSRVNSNEKDAAGSDACGQPGNQSDIMLNACFQNEVQQGSPSVCVDEYLNDSVEAQKGTNSGDWFEKQANNEHKLLECSFSGPRETATFINYYNNGNLKDISMFSAQADIDCPLNVVDAAANDRDLESSDRLLQLTSEKINDQVESKSVTSGAQYYDQYVSQVIIY